MLLPGLLLLPDRLLRLLPSLLSDRLLRLPLLLLSLPLLLPGLHHPDILSVPRLQQGQLLPEYPGLRSHPEDPWDPSDL